MADPVGLIQLQCEAWVQIVDGVITAARGCTVASTIPSIYNVTLSNPIADADMAVFPMGQGIIGVTPVYNSAASTPTVKQFLMFNSGGAPDPTLGAYFVICRVYP